MTDPQLVLLSILPRWAEAILNSEKMYEYRKQVPARDPPYRVILYASSPTKALVGEMRVERVLSDTPSDLIAQTAEETPHSPDDLREYFGGADTGYALEVAETTRYADVVPLTDLRDWGIRPPQNFRYLSEQDHADVLARIESVTTR